MKVDGGQRLEYWLIFPSNLISKRIEIAGLKIDERLYSLVRDEIAPGTGVRPSTGGPVFIIGLGVFLVGTVLCGVMLGRTLRLAVSRTRHRSAAVRG
jgi:hypothetical protein